MSSKTFDRIFAVIDKYGARHLERATGIKADRWNNVKRGGARCTLDELDALTEAFPELELWIRTGMTNGEDGQISLEIEGIRETLKKTGTDTE